MHNNIMAAGSKDRPPMLGPGRYSQWRSRSNSISFKAEKEAIFLLLTGIGDEIYSTVDACNTANEMWIAIERLQQGESLNIQDVKTNLFWEFGKFTSRDGESMESYYSRFYKLMNELKRNNLQVTTMQVNVQFLQQLQPEWSSFRRRLMLFCAGGNSQKCKSIRHSCWLLIPYTRYLLSSSKPQDQMQHHLPNKNNVASIDTRQRGRKPITPSIESVSEEECDSGIQCFNCKGYGHYAKECRKPKRVKDYAYHKEKMMMCKQAEQGVPLQAEQADWLEDTDEEIDEQELEAHYSYMAKIQEVSPEESSSTGQPLEQVQNHDESNVFANERRHSEQPESINDTYVLEKDDSNVTPDSSNICNNDNQGGWWFGFGGNVLKVYVGWLVVDQCWQMWFMSMKEANASLTQELKECRTNLDETGRALGEATSCRDSCLIALQNKQNELEKYIAFNDRTIDYDILQTNCQSEHVELVKRVFVLKSQFCYGQLKEKSKVISDLKTQSDVSTQYATYNGRSTFANPKYLKIAQSEKPCLYEIPYDTSDHANRFCPNGEETVTLEKESRSKLNKDTMKNICLQYQNCFFEIFKPPSKTYLDQLERAKEVRKTMWRQTFVRTKPTMLKKKRCLFYPRTPPTSVSRPQLKCLSVKIVVLTLDTDEVYKEGSRRPP
ncbi:integrase, catalytic region, zinc finger, CCHC-type containing protein [Tanacetum coccineum]